MRRMDGEAMSMTDRERFSQLCEQCDEEWLSAWIAENHDVVFEQFMRHVIDDDPKQDSELNAHPLHDWMAEKMPEVRMRSSAPLWKLLADMLERDMRLH